MRIEPRLAVVSLIMLLLAGPARAVEPAEALPDSMWSDPLWPAPPEEASVPDPLLFLPPIVLEGAAAAAIAPAAGSRAPQGPNTPYVAVGGGRNDARAPSVSFPDGVLSGPQVTLNPD